MGSSVARRNFDRQHGTTEHPNVTKPSANPPPGHGAGAPAADADRVIEGR